MVSTMDHAVQVRALARVTVLCSWARYLTLIVLLSTQVYKWVLGVTLCWPSREEGREEGKTVEILLVT